MFYLLQYWPKSDYVILECSLTKWEKKSRICIAIMEPEGKSNLKTEEKNLGQKS